MYNILDYLKYYKNITLDENKWNRMDSLVCSFLVYLPVYNFKIKTLNEFYQAALSSKQDVKKAIMTNYAYQVLEMIIDCKRYKKLKVYNFINIKNDTTQFGACTFRINNNAIITFKGTDSSLIGWIENFRLNYQYPTTTHTLAIKYLNNNIRNLMDKNIYLTGHSKGGNLAIVSAIESNNKIKKKIKKIYNFDGPGLRKKEFEDEKYKSICNRIENILPSTSYIGTLLYNKNYTYIKSNAKALNNHYCNNWSVFGEYFIQNNPSKITKDLHTSTTIHTENISYEEMNQAFELVFKNLLHYNDKDSPFSLTKLIKIYNDTKKDNIDIFKNVDKIVKLLLKTLYFKEKEKK